MTDNTSHTFSTHLNILNTEYLFVESQSIIMKIFGIFAATLILVPNITLIKYIIKEHKMTFFNLMITTDCFICIANIPAVLRLSVFKMNISFCWLFPSLGYFINILNRLLSITIIFYRYVFVIHSAWVQTPRQRQLFCSILSFSIFGTSVFLSILSFVYREHSLHYLGMKMCNLYIF